MRLSTTERVGEDLAQWIGVEEDVVTSYIYREAWGKMCYLRKELEEREVHKRGVGGGWIT
jgi:hypothetical protein